MKSDAKAKKEAKNNDIHILRYLIDDYPSVL